MFAEWLIDIPEDLYENWCLVCCPVGKRCLVISSNGKRKSIWTQAFRKTDLAHRADCFKVRSGRTLNKFESILPAGSSTYRGNKVTDYCILDCIFDPVHWVYYVLDIMCWKGHPIYDCDTEFRLVNNTKFVVCCHVLY
jgi:snurportin-1